MSKLPIPLWSLLMFAVVPLGAASSSESAPNTASQLDYMVIVTGEELLRGVYADGHTSFITRTLHLRGCHCVGAMTVDDKTADIKQALAFAAPKAQLVIVTGGLGPTVNDVTRTALSDFTGIPLREHPDVLAEMERRFRQPRDQLRANLRRQTLVPERGTYLKNAGGSAVGLVFETDQTVIVALPGPPRELQPMVTNELVPYLVRKFGMRRVGTSLTVRFVGIGQSQIDQTMHDHVPVSNDVVVSSLFEGGRVDFTFALPGDTTEDADRLREIEAGLRRELGEYIYASNGASLEEEVVKRLAGRSNSLVLAEVGSGGHLAASLNRVRDIGRLLVGSYVAPSEDRLRQMLEIPGATTNFPTAEEEIRALGATGMRKTNARRALVISEVRRDDAGAAALWVGFGSPANGWIVQRFAFPGSSDTAYAHLITRILDWLRREAR